MTSMHSFSSGSLDVFLRVYSFLSQILSCQNTEIERLAIFFKALLPLLEFGRERKEIGLSKVILTHHKLKNQNRRDLPLGGKTPKLKPLTDTGSSRNSQKKIKRDWQSSWRRSTTSSKAS